MQYKWEIPAEAEILNTIVSGGDVPTEEIGTFEIFTQNPKKMKSGEGTMLIYIQGVQLKYGRDDQVGNSPLSWVEESIIPSARENIIKTSLLPIGHVALRLNFDHFVTFVFPSLLTSRGFAIAVKRLVTYLQAKKFTVVITGWSNGATLTGEWILDRVALNDLESLKKLVSVAEMVVCAGGPCQTNDHEPLALTAGKIGINRLLKVFYPVADLHPFIKRAGGVHELVSRGKYLMNLDNISKANNIPEENWLKASEILLSNKEFQLVFLADMGQRVVLPQGPINWHKLFSSRLGSQIIGYVAKNVNDPWTKYPSASHGEIRQLWTLVSLIGLSSKLRKELNFSPMASEIADNWPKRRFEPMV